MENNQERLGRIAIEVMFSMLDRFEQHLPEAFDLTLSPPEGASAH